MKPLPVTVLRKSLDEGSASEMLFYRLATFVVLCTILYFARDVLIPIAIAVLLAILLTPLIRLAMRTGLPRSVSIILVVALLMVVSGAVTLFVGRTLTNLAADLPRYEASLREKARSIKIFTSKGVALEKAALVIKGLQVELEKNDASVLPSAAENRTPIPVEVTETRFGPLGPIITVVSMVVHPIVQVVIVVLMLSFILFNREDLRDRLIGLAGTRDLHRTTAALDEGGKRLSRLFLGQLAINTGVGTFIGTALLLLGIPGAPLWGILTTLLRFVPYVATLIASIFPIIIALAVGDGWTLPFLVAGIVIAAEVTAGHILEPVFLGRMTGVSSTAIVVSAAFWAMLWGPVGLILATPITIGLHVLGRNIESMKFLDVLFGSEPVLSPDHALYQRLLNGDSVEAAEAADSYQQQGKLVEFLEAVVVPALALADEDVRRGRISKEKATEIAKTLSDTLDEVWSEEGDYDRKDAPVILIPAHGPINFAATLAFSALLNLKHIPHRMLSQDVLLPGITVDQDDKASIVGLIGLSPLTASQQRYMSRRLAPRIGEAKLLNIAWRETAGETEAVLASQAPSMLPRAQAEVSAAAA